MKYEETLSKKAHEIIFRHRRYKNIDIIKGLGISKASFYNWTNKKHRNYKKEFDRSIKQSKAELLELLEQEIIKQISGYYVVEETRIIENDKIIRQIMTKKWIKGNTKLLIFALKNLNPEKYTN